MCRRYHSVRSPSCKPMMLIWLLVLVVAISGCNSIGATSGANRRTGTFGSSRRDAAAEATSAAQQSEPQPQVGTADGSDLPADYKDTSTIPERVPIEESTPHSDESSERTYDSETADTTDDNVQSDIPSESLNEGAINDLGELRELLNTYKGQHIEPHVPLDEAAITTEGYGHVEVDVLEIRAVDLDTMYINLAVQSYADNGRVAEQYIYGTTDMLSDLSVEFDDDGWDNSGILNVYFLEDGYIGVDCEITKYSSYTDWSLAMEYTVLPPALE